MPRVFEAAVVFAFVAAGFVLVFASVDFFASTGMVRTCPMDSLCGLEIWLALVILLTVVEYRFAITARESPDLTVYFTLANRGETIRKIMRSPLTGGTGGC